MEDKGNEEVDKRESIFKMAIKYVQTSEENKQISKKQQLMFYGLFKQAMEGNCTSIIYIYCIDI